MEPSPREPTVRSSELPSRGRTGLVEETVRVGDVELSLLRPRNPESLLDEEAFSRDEFMPYWAELWPAGLALAQALPERLDGVRAVELGCGLGVPSLVAAAHGASITAVDWAAEAVALLHTNAAANGLAVDARVADWRAFAGEYDLVLAADVLYEPRNVEALLVLLPRLAPEVLLAEPGRPSGAGFLGRARAGWTVEQCGERVYRLTRVQSPG
jgi:predicted nicotinamide N-methyase